MKVVARIFAAILFILFFGFALKNAHEVKLRFFFDHEWQTPLALLLLAFFIAGAVFGILAMTLTLFRKRRELSKCKKALETLQQEYDAQQSFRAQAPQPDVVANN